MPRDLPIVRMRAVFATACFAAYGALVPLVAWAADCAVDGTVMPCEQVLVRNPFASVVLGPVIGLFPGLASILVRMQWAVTAFIIGSLVFELFYLVLKVRMLVHSVRNDVPKKWAWFAFILFTPSLGYLPSLGTVVYYFKVKRRMDAATQGREVPEMPSDAPASPFFTEYYAGAFAFMLAAFAAAALLVVRPIIIETNEAEAKVAHEQEVLAREKQVLAVLSRSVSAAQAIPEDTLVRVSQALPTEPEYPQMLADLSQAALRNGARISSLNFNTPSARREAATTDPALGTVQPIEATINLESPGYFDVKSFLADIEMSLRIMDIVSIDMSSDDQGRMSYAVLVRAYVFVPATSAVPAGQVDPRS